MTNYLKGMRKFSKQDCYCKVAKVILSCKTIKQLHVAGNMLNLFTDKYNDKEMSKRLVRLLRQLKLLTTNI